MSNDNYIVCSRCMVKISGPTQEAVNVAFRGHEKEAHGFMTGQEWLARFQTELAADEPLHDPKSYQYLSKHALAIAKRAAQL